MIDGIFIPALVVGVPMALMALLLVLARLEAHVVAPNERAAQLADLIESPQEPDEVEIAVSRMLAQVAPALERERERV